MNDWTVVTIIYFVMYCIAGGACFAAHDADADALPKSVICGLTWPLTLPIMIVGKIGLALEEKGLI